MWSWTKVWETHLQRWSDWDSFKELWQNNIFLDFFHLTQIYVLVPHFYIAFYVSVGPLASYTLFLFVCLWYVHMCMPEMWYVHTCTPVYGHMCRGQSWPHVSSLIALYIIIPIIIIIIIIITHYLCWDKVSHWSRSSPVGLEWLSMSSGNLPASASSELGFWPYATILRFTSSCLHV